MNLEIIAVGTEILHGDIANTNAQYISKKMELIGVDVLYHSVVGDNEKRIIDVFDIALKRADIIIATGGLGPTQDDITKEAVAKLLNVKMIYDEPSYNKIEAYFAKKGLFVPKNNIRQAFFPEGAEIFLNENGTANACKIKFGSKMIYLLPGVPREVYPLLDKFVISDIQKQNDSVLYYKMIQVFNMSESQSEILLMDLIKSQTNPTIAPYANEKLVYRITAKAKDMQMAKKMVDDMVKKALDILEENGKLLEEE